MKPGLRKRLFAWILKKGDTYNLKMYDSYKKSLFHDLKGTVAEIGPGTGVNLNYLPPGIKWIGIEPNEAFHHELKKRAEGLGIKAELLGGDATNIPLPDNSMDAVLCTLVLCSVVNPVKAVAEMKRILKPGGKLIFIEHVAALAGTGLRKAQNVFNPFNRLAADGCNCNRETWSILENGGFTNLQLSHNRVKGTMKLHAPHIMGYAVK